MSDEERMRRAIQRQTDGLTVGDRIGLAVLYAIMAIPPAGVIFAIMALFHLLPDGWYQGGER